MKNKLLNWFAWFAFLGLCPAALPAEPAANSTTNHSLWKISDQDNTVFLLGSIHFLDSESYPLPDVIEQAFRDSEIVVFEADISAMQDVSTQLRLLGAARYPAGESIREHLSPETYALLKKRLKEFGAAGVAFEHMKPWLVAVSLVTLELQKLGFSPEHGVDQYFHTKARRAGQELQFLETVDFQFGLFTGLTEKEQELLLKQTLEDVDQFEKIFTDVKSAWAKGNSTRLDELVVESMRDYPAIYKRLLTDRNHAWLPKIESLLRGDKDALIVVGVAHLVGKDGLAKLLEQKGHKVPQL